MIGVEGVRGILHRTHAELLDLGPPEAVKIDGNATPPTIYFDFRVPAGSVGTVEAFSLVIGRRSVHRLLEVELDPEQTYVIGQQVEIAEVSE